MSKAKPLSEDPSCLQLLDAKIHARDKLVAAVYAASPAELERAAVLIKAVWRGKSGSIPRPRRFQSLND